MQEDKLQQFHEHLWKSEEEESMELSPEKLCARAHKYERANVASYWMLLALTPFLAAVVIYELARLYAAQKYLLVATECWLLATLCYVAWRLLRGGPRRIGKAEPCVQFLKREFEGKRQFARVIRLWILLLVPAVLAAWWGEDQPFGPRNWESSLVCCCILTNLRF